MQPTETLALQILGGAFALLMICGVMVAVGLIRLWLAERQERRQR